MREPTAPSLDTVALRYAARDLPPAEAAAFEARLAADQDAREALAEAVRLSAAALGQEPPAPHGSFRALIRERVRAWYPGWLSRRAYRGHPLVWAGVGAAAIAAVALVGLQLAATHPPPAVAQAHAPPPVVPVATPIPAGDAVAPAPPRDAVAADESPATGACDSTDMNLKAAEIWADLSTPDHVGKAHDDEARWRQRLRDLQSTYPVHPVRLGAAPDAPNH
jgi:hypothetical protein